MDETFGHQGSVEGTVPTTVLEFQDGQDKCWDLKGPAELSRWRWGMEWCCYESVSLDEKEVGKPKESLLACLKSGPIQHRLHLLSVHLHLACGDDMYHDPKWSKY